MDEMHSHLSAEIGLAAARGRAEATGASVIETNFRSAAQLALEPREVLPSASRPSEIAAS